MKLSALLQDIEWTLLYGEEKEINAIAYDSRKVQKGDLFVCITGFQTDGHKYAQKAIEAGAVAILCEKAIQSDNKDVTILQTKNTRHALAILSSNYYKHPCNSMNVIGVTGTNGKTTTTYLIKSVLDSIGHKVGIVGTIENRIGQKVLHADRTTPESLELQQLFYQMKQENVTDVVMEVSSHSLDLHRVDGIQYNIGIFTNLTQDHLDYHKTMENYKIAKSLLFQRSNKSVINIDDEAGEFMKQNAKGEVLTFGIDKQADITAKEIDISADGVKFTLCYNNKQHIVLLHTPGRFSIYNALGAIGACVFMGIAMEDIIAGLNSNVGVAGRFQTIKSNKANAIVDYAHTPDGLENILKTAQEFVKGKIITVFGCGGDRDKTKRPIMGEIAGKLSDYCIITSDNPRTENPASILDDVEVGMKKTNCEYIKLVDRREAIRHAVEYGQKGDLIIIAGKGHEDYQIFADKTIHFDDVEEVKKAFGGDTL